MVRRSVEWSSFLLWCGSWKLNSQQESLVDGCPRIAVSSTSALGGVRVACTRRPHTGVVVVDVRARTFLILTGLGLCCVYLVENSIGPIFCRLQVAWAVFFNAVLEIDPSLPTCRVRQNDVQHFGRHWVFQLVRFEMFGVLPTSSQGSGTRAALPRQDTPRLWNPWERPLALDSPPASARFGTMAPWRLDSRDAGASVHAEPGGRIQASGLILRFGVLQGLPHRS